MTPSPLSTPTTLASCPHCRHLVLAWTVQEEERTEVVWDPDEAGRDLLRSLVPSLVAGQGFAAGRDTWHVCRPREPGQRAPGTAAAPRTGFFPSRWDNRSCGPTGPHTEGRHDA